jgi:hypothetical protein
MNRQKREQVSINMTGYIRPRRASAMVLLFCLVLTLSLVAPTSAQPDDDARMLLKRMSDYLASQQTIHLTFDSAIEVITPTVEKIQFTSSGEAVLVRPDKLFAHRVGGHTDVALFFDGRAVTVYGKAANAYARLEGPQTVDALIEALRAGHGVALPGADLLLSNAFDVLVADVIEARHLGRGVVGGRACEHLAFRNFDTDWQLWVESGERPVPCKLVITSKTINAAPQYTLLITAWQSGMPVNPGIFAFRPPADARVLGADELIIFDELPQGAPAGGGQ